MARSAIVFGVLLCGVTLYGLMATTTKSPIQFFPLMLGIPIFFCGIVGLNPHRRRVSLPIAAVVAGLGAVVGSLATFRCFTAWSEGHGTRPILLILGVSMTVLTLLFLATYTASSWHLRRRR